MKQRKKFPPKTTSNYRSGLEEQIVQQLKRLKISFGYESEKIPYIRPEKLHKYTPDFILHKKVGTAMYIESKGRFLTADKQKHILLRKQYPELDLRFVFSNSKTRISKKSRTTYAMWCQKHGFKYADRFIPENWIKELWTSDKKTTFIKSWT